MKNIFVAVGIEGRPADDILDYIKRASVDIHLKYGKYTMVGYNTCIDKLDKSNELCHLGNSIDFFSMSDAVYFYPDWMDYKESKAIHMICEIYDIPIIEGIS